MRQSQAVTLEGVSKRFETVAAVDGVSLEVRSGEFFSLLGPSGCGKTTSLRMIAGFERPDAGRILIGAADVRIIGLSSKRGWVTGLSGLAMSSSSAVPLPPSPPPHAARSVPMLESANAPAALRFRNSRRAYRDSRG
jgi:energy-coupling factor transporter ATP-binding protein EcfA2